MHHSFPSHDAPNPRRRLALGHALLAVVWGLLLFISLPATLALATDITVNTTHDELDNNGNCSLREAVQAANLDMAVDGCPAGTGADRVLLPAGAYQLVITAGINSGPIQPKRPLIIQGAGRDQTFIESGPGYTDRLLYFFDDEFELRGVTVRNGKALGGILVSSNATLLISDTAVISNASTVDGGGIDNFGDLRIVNSLIAGNQSSQTGGGMWMRNKVTLQNSQIMHNRTVDDGGGILNDGGALRVLDSTVADNRGGRGGGVLSHGGNALIADSVVARNIATDTFGGGLVNLLGIMTVTQSTVENNEAAQAAGGIGSATFNFPGLTFGQLRVENSHIFSNTAPDAGGIGTAGQLELVDSEVSYNEASTLGGGLGNDSFVFSTTTSAGLVGTSFVTGTVFHANRAARGGGIANGSTLTVIGGSITDNVATERGGGMSIGGGVASVTQTVFSRNQAPIGAGIFNTYESQYQGARTTASFSEVTLAENQDDGLVVAGGTVTVTALMLDQNNGANCVVTGGTLTSTGGNQSTDDSCKAFFTAPGDANEVTPAMIDIFLPFVRR